MERRTCSFCGNEIEPGTGKMYIKKDGTVYYFCKNKCHKNLLKLKRVPHRTQWTSRYAEMKSVRLAPEKEKKAPKKKVRKKARKKTTKKAKPPSSKKEE
ncbi:MAG: 50S ribosomal protein L24e [Methanobacteriota archaeon]|nr:MAG: 50S ribosomal protein L24e [Euryarchaeota archaeon]